MLRAALGLFAERGYGGASLRELARRLGVQQPSLYHYFETKEQLVEQVIVNMGAELLTNVPDLPIPDELEEVPGFAINAVMAIWEDASYAMFVRFLFVVASEQPRHRNAIRQLYSFGAQATAAALLEPFISRGELDREDGYSLLRTGINSVALMHIEEKLLYGQKKTSPELRAHAVATERWLRDAIRHRRASK